MGRKIYVGVGVGDTGLAAFGLVADAVARIGASAFRLESLPTGGSAAHTVLDAIESADIVVLDLGSSTPNVMFEAGIASAQRKPLLAIATGLMLVPISLAGIPVFRYNLENPDEFIDSLAHAIAGALSTPEQYILSLGKNPPAGRAPVFISYSHADSEYLERLLVHLKPLERDGLIDLWVDTRLRPGDRWKKEISAALERAQVAILLISADFLASDFITNDELPPILTAAEQKGTRIIPIILKPCRFARDKNLRHFQAINDPGHSLLCCTPHEQESLYDAVAAEVEQLSGRA